MSLLTKAGFLLLKIAIVPLMLVEGAVFGPFQHTVSAITEINILENLIEHPPEWKVGLKKEADSLRKQLKELDKPDKKKKVSKEDAETNAKIDALIKSLPTPTEDPEDWE